MLGTPAGTHCILELFECPCDLLNDELFVRDALKQASKQSMSALLDIFSHKFQPQSVTALGLLAESHISIHTWPEHSYAAIDVFTCGQDAEPHKACDFLVRYFVARRHQLKIVPRGGSVPAPTYTPATPLKETASCRALS